MKIKSIKKRANPELTVDIQVSGNHTYQLSNGWISHNTVSQLVNASSGMHPRYAPFYIRRVRISATDPLFKMLKDTGIPYSPEVGQEKNTMTYVLEFPVKAPDNAITRHDITAVEQLDYWKKVKENFTEHNPSTTIYVAEDEWIKVGSWVWDNWNMIGGLSFLPKEDTNIIYELAPYEEIDEAKYNELVGKFPVIDYSQLVFYEASDNTIGSSEGACMGSACDLI